MRSNTNVELANVRPLLKRTESAFWQLAAIEMLSTSISDSKDGSISGYDFGEVSAAISAISQSAIDEISAILAEMEEEDR